MEVRPRQLYFYRTDDGRSVVEDWLESLGDARTRARLKIRLDRLESGLFGDCGSAGAGVVELREHFGPGYRIYVAPDGAQLVVLLCGGDKRTQDRDVRIAQKYWTAYKGRKKKGGPAA